MALTLLMFARWFAPATCTADGGIVVVVSLVTTLMAVLFLTINFDILLLATLVRMVTNVTDLFSP